MFPADQMTFHQHLLIHGGHTVHGFGIGVGHLWKRLHCWTNRLKGADSICLFCPTRKSKGFEVSSQPNPAGKNDLGVGAFAPGRFSRRAEKLVNVFAHGEVRCPSLALVCLISSRKDAAISKSSLEMA